MRVRTVIIVGATIFSAALGLPGHSETQSSSEATWSLPHGLAVKDVGPRTFSFAQKRDFMEGFRYHNDLGSTFRPDFFKGFPPTAVMERNLVWDTAMIEMFGQNYFDHLKLNEPYHAVSDRDTDIPAVGRFHNRDVVLEWVGRSKRNAEDCALIAYQAFFNPLEIAVGGMTMRGRSDYWGQIWVSVATKQIEYATIYESVMAEMKLPGQDAPQIVNVFRSGSLEPISAK